MVFKTIKPSIPGSRILCFLLSSIAAIAFGAVFAEESSCPKEAAIEVMPADPMTTTKDSVINLPTPCEELHNASRLEELRALTLAAAAKDARSISERARNEYLTLQQTLAALPAYMGAPSKNKSSDNKSSKAQPGSKLIWMSADIMLRQLTPREVRNRGRNKNSSDQNAAPQPQTKISIPREEFAAPLIFKAAQAGKAAEDAVLAAEDAEKAAGKARAAANEAHLSYDKCIGKQGAEQIR